jgi:FPC/CPF motif-containing protein YcgG
MAGVLTRSVPNDLAAFIRASEFPCVGAKASLLRDKLFVLEAGRLDEAGADARIYSAIVEFADHARADELSSAAILFAPADHTEDEFEASLWDRLQKLHDIDVQKGIDWNHSVSADPKSAAFSFSIAGEPFFIVGMHPNASRLARRFNRPALFFNSHDQFERLKADGRYFAMQRAIRARDEALEGDINPMLADFGSGLEAPQYSGRQVDAGWECPFKAKNS